MAGKRMFSVKIVDTDAFTEMPNDSQLLYFRLCLAADDDGFVSNPRKVMRSFGISEDSMKILIAKKFVLVLKYNDSAILLIKHWKMHNTIKNDRYTPSPYHELLQYIYLDVNKAYSLTPGDGKRPALYPYSDSDPNWNRIGTETGTEMDPKWIQNGSSDKNSIGLDKCSVEESSKSLGEEINNTPILDPSIGKGECERENQGRPEMTDPERLEKIKKHSKSIDVHLRFGYPTDGIYCLAAADGITKDEIDEYRRNRP